MIPFNKAAYTGNEDEYIIESIKRQTLSGDGYFNKKCEQWFEKALTCKKALLTPSCTAALEMCALLLDIKKGDEVIIPSYTFVSTANAFVLRGAKIIFVDIRPDTMNIDENKIENAITEKTKAIVVVHYAGISCEMDKIMNIANKYNIFVIEDSAQGMMSTYQNKPLGTIGHLGCYSFHETKNYTSGGEGGLLIINDEKFVKRAEVIREKGTNRKAFFRGEVDKYSWVDIGSSYLMNEVSAAYLWGQLQNTKQINQFRLNIWNIYYESLKGLEIKDYIALPFIPYECRHNGHLFYIKVKNISIRNKLLQYLKDKDISSVFHYIPLHTSLAGIKYGQFNGVDEFTTKESEKLVRLPMFFGLQIKEAEYIIDTINFFFKNDKK